MIATVVKHVWNVAMHVLHNFMEVVIGTTAYQLGQCSLHLLLLKSSMVLPIDHYHRAPLLLKSCRKDNWIGREPWSSGYGR